MNPLRFYMFMLVLFIYSVKSENQSIDEIKSSLNLNNYNYKNQSYSGYELVEEEGEEDCSLDESIDLLSEIILPDDFENNQKIKTYTEVKHLNQTFAILKRLYNWKQNISLKLNPFVYRFISISKDLLLSLDLNKDCLYSIERIGIALEKRERWAMKFLDSMPSMSSGMLDVSTLPFAEYDECLNIISPQEYGMPLIKGQYCQLSVTLPLPERRHYEISESIDPSFDYILEQFSFKTNNSIEVRKILATLLEINDHMIAKKFKPIAYGLCLPTNCLAKDFQLILNSMIYPKTNLSVEIDQDCDHLDKPISWKNQEIIAIIIFSLLITISIISALIEKYIKSLSSILSSSFSIKNNWNKLITIERNNLETRLQFIDGLRALLPFWVFLSNEYWFCSLNVLANKSMKATIPFKFFIEDKYLLLRNLNISHVFILIGSTILSHNILTRFEKNEGKFDYINYVLHRYFRIIPSIIGSILMLYLLRIIGDGPIWNRMMSILLDGCYLNWDSTLLLVQNYKFDIIERPICNTITWYSATDFQLYLLAPLVFLFLNHRPKIGTLLNILVIIGGCFIAGVPKYLYRIPLIYELKSFESFDSFESSLKHNFYGIEQFIGIYALGILLGFLIKCKLNLNFGGAIGQGFVWITTIGLTIIAILWPKDYFQTNYTITERESLLFILFQKYLFISGWVWIIYACAKGKGGFLNYFLGQKYFKFFSKISFEIYLVHTIPIMYRMSSVRDPIRVTDIYMAQIIPFDFVLTLILSIFLNLFITQPFSGIVKSLSEIDISNTHLITEKTLQGYSENVKNVENICKNTLKSVETSMNLQELTNYTIQVKNGYITRL